MFLSEKELMDWINSFPTTEETLEKLSKNSKRSSDIEAGAGGITDKNLDAANEFCATIGFPPLDRSTAERCYARTDFDYYPDEPDRGCSAALAGSSAWADKWRINVILHEGVEGLEDAEAAYEKAVEEALPAIAALDGFKSEIHIPTGMED